MEVLTSLIDSELLISSDASAVKNLNATGCAETILRSIPNKMVVVDVVQRELEEGRLLGRRDADCLNELVSAGIVEIKKLGHIAEVHFERLVVGPAAMTLDDGEAATIAYAIASGAMAVVDERKATRLCSELFPDLRIGCTVDILAHPNVQDKLGSECLEEAVFKALFYGRMRVPMHHIEWVISLIGRENAAKCSSLPNSVRKVQ
jgi:predicted nucleic acid-binding protein